MGTAVNAKQGMESKAIQEREGGTGRVEHASLLFIHKPSNYFMLDHLYRIIISVLLFLELIR